MTPWSTWAPPMAAAMTAGQRDHPKSAGITMRAIPTTIRTMRSALPTFRLTHAALAIAIPPFVPASVPKGRPSHDSGFLAVAGIEPVPQPIAHQVEAHGRHENGGPWKSGVPPLVEQEGAAAVHHRSPLRSRRPHAEAEKAQGGGEQHCAPHVQGG